MSRKNQNWEQSVQKSLVSTVNLFAKFTFHSLQILFICHTVVVVVVVIRQADSSIWERSSIISLVYVLCGTGSTVFLCGKLICLVVVIDLHLGWLQALHGDVPLHCEGEAEGLPAQLFQVQ